MEIRFYDYLARFWAICQVFSGIVGATRRELGEFAYPMGLDRSPQTFFYTEIVFMKKLKRKYGP